MKVIVAQKGSREDYLAARALYRSGMLAQMVADWYIRPGLVSSILSKSRYRPIGRAFSSHSAELPEHLIKSINFTGFKDRIRRSRAKKIGGIADATLIGDIDFATTVSRLKLPPHDAFFCYSYSSLEALREEKRRGKLCILDQIDPGEKEHEIIREEEARWPEYVVHKKACIPRLIYERLHEEWALADIIIVNSQWSANCNISKGAPASKLFVLPLAYEPGINLAEKIVGPQPQCMAPVRVLWVGRITLQKGIQYLIEAAKLLRNEPVVFYIAGELSISALSVSNAPKNIKWLGKITHHEKAVLYSSSTVFVLPTLSDGFALTQLESLAHGLPVIATKNCGLVVEDARTGFIVPPRDPRALADKILKFVADRNLSSKMAPACKAAIKSFSIDAYSRRLLEIINNNTAR